MRRIIEMDTVQIETTNACVLQCGNCTRFCGHHRKPYMMSREQFTQAVDSMIGFPQMVGLMGGEPLLHPEFEWMCEYALSKLGREHLGLWTVLPQKYAHYRDTICKTFKHIFINDHTRPDIYHAPLLVSAKEVYEKLYPTDPKRAKSEMWQMIDRCWIQNSWSACINPHGAFFCEVAGAFSMLLGGPMGWPVEPGWWMRIPKDYREQMETWCTGCGAALPLKRRSSQDERDDVSPMNLERLRACGSRKEKQNLYQISDLQMVQNPEPMAAYKDTNWRNKIAGRYGMFLTINENRFWEPHLMPKWDGTADGSRNLFAEYAEAYKGGR
ncbi:MAG: radical SAM protein [Bryobacteraceae bacterium]